jgi:hypothetical protein
MAMPIWRKLLLHAADLPDSLACDSAGKSMAAKIAMMAMTTSNSMSVNAVRRELIEFTGIRSNYYHYK